MITDKFTNGENELFIFFQEGKKWTIDLNTMLDLYKRDGVKTKNPFTNKLLNNNAISRLQKIDSEKYLEWLLWEFGP